jgi:hypothetical protein
MVPTANSGRGVSTVKMGVIPEWHALAAEAGSQRKNLARRILLNGVMAPDSNSHSDEGTIVRIII